MEYAGAALSTHSIVAVWPVSSSCRMGVRLVQGGSGGASASGPAGIQNPLIAIVGQKELEKFHCYWD